jgi:hypothetical protein
MTISRILASNVDAGFPGGHSGEIVEPRDHNQIHKDDEEESLQKEVRK